MATHSVQRPDTSVLGDSWVLADANSQSLQRKSVAEIPQRRQDEVKSRRSYSQPARPSSSPATSVASVSGPELIMPSIYDDTISEASWVAPQLRHRRGSLHKHKKTEQSSPEAAQRKPQIAEISLVTDDHPIAERETASGLFEKAWDIVRLIGGKRYMRNIVTIFLLLSIFDLLVLPELVYQYPKLCSVSLVPSLYSASCAQRHGSVQPKRSPAEIKRLSQYRSIARSQAQFEAALSTTIHEINLVPSPLKKEESALRDLYSQLKTTYKGAKYELDLEFQGTWPAIRSASLQLDLLTADMVSALDRLEEESRMTKQLLRVPGQVDDDVNGKEKGSSNGRLGFPVDFPWRLPRNGERSFPDQVSHHAHILQRQASLIKSRVDAVVSDISKMDEHLESIEEVLSREERASSDASQNDTKSLVSDATRLIRRVSSLVLDQNDESQPENQEIPMSSLLREVVSHHRRVAHALEKLDNKIQVLQKRIP
ncbi:hypothetical protein AOR_1_1898174 [Paecilomyces variotii No. 5]|uniref:Uncharacterized protein n=1 Tax=Byssochlamys spectabilis (strain No. 5 / NBRC 109023) TaxID=1356009 RepID=V5G0M5_BYSSN|nr:hypothetical protein AOR_1_1898174 [Paecilomyces variotii No. 5]